MKGLNTKLITSFVLSNLLVIIIINYLAPADVVIGNLYFKGFFAILWISLVMTVFVNLFYVALDNLGVKYGREKYPMLLSLIGINIVLYWLLSRIPTLSALGISRYGWAIALGISSSVLQWFSRLYFSK